MAELPADFWSGWVVVLCLVSFAGLCWLVLSVYFLPAGDDHGGAEPVWDETLREGQNPAPIWWFWMILAAMVFSVFYLMLYPGLGSFAGAFRWSQGGQLAEHQQQFESEYAEVRARLQELPLTELAADPVAMDAAARLFRDNCAACHGSDAGGQARLFPNLRDPEWQWGGAPEKIVETITNGRVAAMPAWQAALGDEGVAQVAAYVQSLGAGGGADHPGRAQYQQFCVACHGMNGEGNPLLGAPRLSDAEWTYGGELAVIASSIAKGRGGQMPAFGTRLDALQTRLLAAWLAP